MSDQFGAGSIFATPLNDANGNPIANPSPVQFGILQGVTFEDTGEIKKLYGANQYPVDAGRGKSDVTIKAKYAFISSLLYNSIYYGQTLAAGYNAIYNDLVGQLIPTGAGATSINITPTAPYGGTSTFAADLGVQDQFGNPMTRVASSPTGGQYALAGSTYSFSNQDSGKTAYINYQYSNSTNPSSGKVLVVQNLPMGQVPIFSLQFYIQRFNAQTGQKSSMWRQFPACVATKLSMDFKNDDFVIPDFEASILQGPGNTVQKIAFSE